jgi:methionyl aminopeptidase
MITIKNKAAIQKMEHAGMLLEGIFKRLEPLLHPGMSTYDIDAWIERELLAAKLVSQTKGYMGYRHASCISVNDEVVHGIPDKKKRIASGDLVKVDVCAAWQGYCADMTRAYMVDAVQKPVEDLVRVAYQALEKGIAQARAGNRVSDISAAIQQEVEKYGYGVVRDFAGHGIGKHMHEDPEVLNYGKPGEGPLLRPGMALAIEPMITMGSYKVYVAEDGWTVKTVDASWAAHVEDTVIITAGDPKVITKG